MNANEKFKMVADALESGKTVLIFTRLGGTKFTPRVYKKFKSEGLELIKVKGNSFYARFGSKMLCADGCSITIQETAK